MTADVLDARARNRATLARQLLLERADLAPVEAITHLVGLQAQVPNDPYTALWSRLRPFDPDAVGRLLVDRQLVRTWVMRGTIHLVTADDALPLRTFAQPAFDGEVLRHPEFGRCLATLNLPAVMDVARPLLAEPRTGPQLRAALAEALPEHDPAAIAFACRCLLPLVQVPPRGVWGQRRQVTLVDATVWLDRPAPPAPTVDRGEIVRRYLAAFGPATVADVATWSRLTGLGQVIEDLRDELRWFRDESGREVFDLAAAPRPDRATPAPVRFLPEYDNALLSHADRGVRFGVDDVDVPLFDADRPGYGAVLVDGMVRASWRIDRASTRKDAPVTLLVRHVPRMPKRAQSAVGAEARRLVRFLAPTAAERVVRLEAAG